MTRSTKPTAIDPRAARAWPFLRELASALPGAVVIGPDGTTVRIREDGGADEVGAVPRRWSVSADPTATRRRAA